MFPISSTGFRAVILTLLCAWPILILRIAQYHVGIRTSNSAFQTFAQHALQIQTAEAVLTYSISAFVFSMVFLFSRSEGSGLELVAYLSADRARLNEKALFFMSNLFFMAVQQALLHVYKDNDRLLLGIATPAQKKIDEQNAQNGPASTEGPYKRFLGQLPFVGLSSVTQALVGVLISMFFYPMFLRSIMWRLFLALVRPFYNLPRTNMLPSSLPFGGKTIWYCFIANIMISFIWTAGNTAFSIFLVKEPLKNGKPLTSESKDPNGTLLNGLKNKKLAIKVCSMLGIYSFVYVSS